jgi:uncharacterized protein (TIGR02145 family)
MRYLITLLFAALSLNAVGQTNQNYNPDYDDDGVIGVSDILGILSTFGDTWDSGDVMVIEITPITNDNIHEAVDLWLSDECSATLTYGHISDWDVSSVTNMGGLFREASNFNGDLSSWDVSSVTNMDSMFEFASSFNSDISSWDVSSVTSMEGTFYAASNFVSELNSWDISSVTDMRYMFREANNFTSDLSSWDVSSVTNMSQLFLGASSFNSDISSWDVSSVTQMRYMFQYASSFNGDISSWDVSNVSSMVHMFNDADAFNGDISSWDVANVTNMEGTFYSADSFNQDISSWEVSNVITMVNMLNNTALSEENQCLIHTSFSSNLAWPYEWSEFCPAVFNSCGDDIGHEGYDYSTVQIGDQCWFSENCRYLPEVSPSSEESNTTPYYYVYDYQGTDVEEAQATTNYETYGVLYNWPAVMTEGICPSGWHVPSEIDFIELFEILGGASVAGEALKSTSGWYDEGDGSNSSGWTGLPGGLTQNGGMGYMYYDGYFWTSSPLNFIILYGELPGIGQGGAIEQYGMSARCIKD